MKITLLRIDKMRTNFIFYKKSTITLLFLVVFSMFGSSQTTFSWRNDQNPTSGQWNVSNYWWNGSGAALPSGGEILFLDGSVGTTMTNDLPSTNRFRIIFGSGGSSRVVNGTIENTFYDYGSNKPKIENNSSAAQTINFPVKAGYNPLELNPINGDLTIYSSINNDGNYIDIYGPNNKVLTLSGTIIGSGGISLKQNSKLVLSTNAKSYTGATVLEAGTLDLSISLASSVITVNSGSKLFITGTDVTINDLTIETGGVVEVQAGKALTVTGTLTNKAGAGGLVVKSGGSLIQKSAIQATVERDIPAWTSVPHGWHFLSSPVAAQAISPDFTNAAATNYDFYAWREPDNTWINFKNTSTSPTWNETNGNTSFAPGKGYLVAYASSGTIRMLQSATWALVQEQTKVGIFWGIHSRRQ